MLDIRVHESLTVDDLGRHAAAWNALALAAPEQLPMLSHAWVASFLESNLQASRDWRCLFAYADGRLVGVLPIVRARRYLPGRRFEGTFGVHAHTRSGYPLLEPACAREALAAMLAALDGANSRYVWLRFGGVRGGSALLSADPPPAARVTPMTAPDWTRTGSTLPVLGSFDDYELGLQANFRRNLRKARNRCEREHEVAFRFLGGVDARSADLLPRFLDLEAAGWKGATGTAIKCTPRLVEFYSALSERLGERGWLEWHFLELDGSPVAGHLAVRFGRSLVLLKIAYDERFARLGPGNLLFRETVARAFADRGVEEINCVSSTPWHQNWCMSTASYGDIVITPHRPVPTLAGLVELETPALARRTLARARRSTVRRLTRAWSDARPR